MARLVASSRSASPIAGRPENPGARARPRSLVVTVFKVGLPGWATGNVGVAIAVVGQVLIGRALRIVDQEQHRDTGT